MNEREKKIIRMAAAISESVDLSDPAKVALDLVVFGGFHGSDIGNDLPRVIEVARILRASSHRNQIVDIASTVAQLPTPRGSNVPA